MTYLHNSDELSLAIEACSWDNAKLLSELHDRLREIQVLTKVWNDSKRRPTGDGREVRDWRNVTSIRYRGNLVDLNLLEDEETV